MLDPARTEAPVVAGARHAVTLLTDQQLADLMVHQEHLIASIWQGQPSPEVQRLRWYHKLSLDECKRRGYGE